MAKQQVIVSILADTKKFSRSMRNLARETGLSGLGSKFKNLGGKIAGAFKTGIKWIGATVAALAVLALKGGFERALKIEDAQAKLAGLGHDTETIEQIMDSALQSVQGTAAGLDDAATIAASAVAAGIKPGQDLTDALTLVNDAATIAGVGLADMSSIFTKVWTSGRAQTQELNQIADRGIPIWQALADHYGVSADELRTMVSQGKVDAETFATVMNDIVGGSALEAGNTTRGAFANMKAALSRTGQAFLTNIFPMFKDAFKGITTWLDGVTEKVGPLGEAFGKWIADVAVPAVKDFGKWVGSTLVPALQDLWRIISGAFKTALETISSAFADAGVSAEGAGNGLKDGLIKALEIAGPILRTIITGVGSFVGWLIRSRDILIPLGVAIGTIVGAFVTFNKVMKVARAVQLAFNAVMLMNPIVLITTLLVGLVAGLVWFFTQTETGRKIIDKAWKGIKSAISAVSNWFTNSLVPALKRVWAAITGFFTGAATKAKSAWTAVDTFFRQLPGRIKAVFASAANWLVNSGKNILRGLKNGAVNIWSTVIGWVRDRKTAVVNVFANAGNWLLSAGRRIIDGFINGIHAKWQSVKNTLSNLTNLLPSWKGPEDKDKRLLTGAGELVIDGFIRGLESKYGAVKRSLRTLTDEVTGTDMGSLAAPSITPARLTPGASLTAAAAGAGIAPQITVHALMDGPEIGRRVLKAIRDYERQNGTAR